PRAPRRLHPLDAASRHLPPLSARRDRRLHPLVADRHHCPPDEPAPAARRGVAPPGREVLARLPHRGGPGAVRGRLYGTGETDLRETPLVLSLVRLRREESLAALEASEHPAPAHG